jgi:hypothetical protein
VVREPAPANLADRLPAAAKKRCPCMVERLNRCSSPQQKCAQAWVLQPRRGYCGTPAAPRVAQAKAQAAFQNRVSQEEFRAATAVTGESRVKRSLPRLHGTDEDALLRLWQEERTRRHGDFDPFPAARDDRGHGAHGTRHVVLELRHIFLGRAFL